MHKRRGRAALSRQLQQRDSQHDDAGIDVKVGGQIARRAAAQLDDRAKRDRLFRERQFGLLQLADQLLFETFEPAPERRFARPGAEAIGFAAAPGPPTL